MKDNNNNKARQKPTVNSGYLINESIKADQVRVITAEGKNLGLIAKREAVAMAQDAALDLVQIGEDDGVVIARIMNFGKFLYEKKKQQHEAKKHQKVIQIKELKFRPHIGEQDYQIRINQAVDFLKDGKRVKCTLQFRGREAVTMNDFGPKLFARIKQDLEKHEIGTLVEEQESKGMIWSKIFFIK